MTGRFDCTTGFYSPARLPARHGDESASTPEAAANHGIQKAMMTRLGQGAGR
jgi:hypothetical protein